MLSILIFKSMISPWRIIRHSEVKQSRLLATLSTWSPSTPLGFDIPEKVWSGKDPSYAHLKVFGCKAFLHVPKEQRSKLDSKATPCIFVGYGDFEKTEKTSWVVHDDDVILTTVPPRRATNGGDEQGTELSTDEPAIGNDEFDGDDDIAQPDAAGIEQGEQPPLPENTEPQLRRSTRGIFHPPVQLSKGKRPLKNKWVLKLKKDGNKLVRYKARLVVKGFTQKAGIDFDEIFSPVVKMSSIRVVLGLDSSLNLEIEQLDVKTAFFHGDLQKDIYMDQPEGFEVKGKEHMVYMLKNSLYGLKQAPRQWYKKFNSFMVSHLFTRTAADRCVYFRSFGNDFIVLLLYVDDMLIVGRDVELICKLKDDLSRSFDMKDLGPAKQILGMDIIRDRKAGKLRLSQEKSSIDSASGGAFIEKTPAEAWTLVKNMAANTQQFGSREDYSREGNIRRINEVSTHSTTLEQQLQKTNQQIAMLTDLFHVNFLSVLKVCRICSQGHYNDKCPTLEDKTQEVNAVGVQEAYQRKPEPYWRAEQPSQPIWKQRSTKNLIATKGTVSAITLRSRKDLEEPYPTHATQDEGEPSYTKEGELQVPVKEIKIEDEPILIKAIRDGGKDKETAAVKPKDKKEIHFPSRLKKSKPKQLCTNKKRLQGKVSAGANVSAMLQKSLPPMCKDPGTFSITCSIGRSVIENAMLDLGASLSLADGSMVHPKGVVENVLIKVEHFIFPIDIFVMDMEHSKDQSPLLLGRPFLRNSHTKIDVFNGSLTMEFEGDVIHPRISSQSPLKSNDFVYVVNSKWVEKGTIEEFSSTMPAQISKVRQRIASFQQRKDEKFYQAWDRFKMLCVNCPHHGITQHILITYFYQGLGVDDQILVDNINDIPLFDRTPDAAYEALKALSKAP
ncbi:Retrotransposon gag protein [Corchorus capsularis]|uniref:Retrotransposon gag protein n=1 Tax=Corchorus capsularis TaxID=210143 RepID=A0A1R3JHG4_COCAP|nr:Retrotransposon gag protein [Corchorus capsularis]